jgi:hypothetical protein
LLEYSEYILKRAQEESEEEEATATETGASEEEEVTTLTGAAELKDDESDDSEAIDLGLGSFLSLDAPSADEETGVVAETAAEESAERVEEVFVLTIVFDYTHISSVFLSIF